VVFQCVIGENGKWGGLADMFLNRQMVFDVDQSLIKTVFNELNYQPQYTT